MSKTIIKCPHCNGQKLTISLKMTCDHCYTLDNNKLYESRREMAIPTGVIWIFCINCLQNDNIYNPSWKATEDEKKVINEMLMENFSIDVTKYMKE